MREGNGRGRGGGIAEASQSSGGPADRSGGGAGPCKNGKLPRPGEAAAGECGQGGPLRGAEKGARMAGLALGPGGRPGLWPWARESGNRAPFRSPRGGAARPFQAPPWARQAPAWTSPSSGPPWQPADIGLSRRAGRESPLAAAGGSVLPQGDGRTVTGGTGSAQPRAQRRVGGRAAARARQDLSGLRCPGAGTRPQSAPGRP